MASFSSVADKVEIDESESQWQVEYIGIEGSLSLLYWEMEAGPSAVLQRVQSEPAGRFDSGILEYGVIGEYPMDLLGILMRSLFRAPLQLTYETRLIWPRWQLRAGGERVAGAVSLRHPVETCCLSPQLL